jgi:hypothetical protein
MKHRGIYKDKLKGKVSLLLLLLFINVDVWVSLRVTQLIQRVLKLMTMHVSL